MRRLLSLCFILFVICNLSSQNNGNKDIYGNPQMNGNLGYPEGSFGSKLNTNTGFVLTSPIVKNKSSLHFKFDRNESEDSTSLDNVKITAHIKKIENQYFNLNDIEDSIKNEGVMLYKLRILSILCLKKMNRDTKFNDSIFLYENDSLKVFYSSNNKIVAISKLSKADSLFDKNSLINYKNRDLSNREKLLISIQSDAKKIIEVSPNFDKEKKQIFIFSKDSIFYVYVLPDFLYDTNKLLGGDIIFKYNEKGKILDVKNQHIKVSSLYENILKHNHSIDDSDFITATDICQIKLFKDFGLIKEDSFVVRSLCFLSIYDFDNNSLHIEKITPKDCR